ncbi:hypothetical protein E2C01_017710 [Portunus trituberculatus]|uniref:Uncharacterized protein n=1 Tax=Portunus trituberculatus TaxID=210409 RepID=A0A5B7DUJ1_PORTR|nr:hypothetical protein [Portunus trituberculatus]
MFSAGSTGFRSSFLSRDSPLMPSSGQRGVQLAQEVECGNGTVTAAPVCLKVSALAHGTLITLQMKVNY